ncbi:MAG: DUF5693 family protein, partial [Fimbriimonadaceae bacterium]|nr:DUF5693 family protein [Fimbriimonadaceae bacterium]
ALVLSLIGLGMRHRAESANRAVGLTAEFTVVQDLSSASGLSTIEGLKRLKDQGLTAVTLSETLAGEAVADGRLEIRRLDAETSLLLGDPAVVRRLERASGVQVFEYSGPPGWTISLSPTRVRGLSLGLSPEEIAVVQAAGLGVIARHGNSIGLTRSTLEGLIREAKEAGGVGLLPSGDSVPGRRDLQDDLAEILKAEGLPYLTAEFSRMSGDDAIRTRIPELTLRLHAAQFAEIDRLTPAAYIERYVKAATERNIRWLLLRPLSTVGENPLSEFAGTMKEVNDGLRREGLTAKLPRPFTDPGIPSALVLLIFLSAVPLVFWAASGLLGSGRLAWAAAGLYALLAAGALTTTTRPFAALACAIAFPVAAALWLESRPKIRPWADFAVLIGLSLIGGLVVASTLTGVGWMLQNRQFTGIKAAHFLPIGLAGLTLLRRRVSLSDVMRQPILWGTAAAAMIGAAGIMFMLNRTGNDSPGAVSGLELQFRSLLDQILPVRPRTKEFLIGHPALLVGLLILARRPKDVRWHTAGLALVFLGFIGLTSIVNTLCHLHTPVYLSLLRIAIGLGVGAAIGALVWLVVGPRLSKEEPGPV